MKHAEIERWLREESPARLELLWAEADRVRDRWVGDEVHLRGLIEISNVCARQCTYCGIRAGRKGLTRYRMTADEILASADCAVRLGYGTVVLQAGEDPDLDAAWMADVIGALTRRTPLAVTLSLGERDRSDLALWREAGADRYLLRFETSDPDLFARIHPARADRGVDRIGMLTVLRELGYEVGSGVMVGIPGQTYEGLARDVALFRETGLDMIGIGPWIADPNTPLGSDPHWADASVQVPPTAEMAYKVVALTRILCPRTNIPSTTALATICDDGRRSGLQRGANVVMPNVTPAHYRALYAIYPAKACLSETDDFDMLIKQQMTALGRTVGVGRGDSPRYAATPRPTPTTGK